MTQELAVNNRTALHSIPIPTGPRKARDNQEQAVKDKVKAVQATVKVNQAEVRTVRHKAAVLTSVRVNPAKAAVRKADKAVPAIVLALHVRMLEAVRLRRKAKAALSTPNLPKGSLAAMTTINLQNPDKNVSRTANRADSEAIATTAVRKVAGADPSSSISRHGRKSTTRLRKLSCAAR